MKGDYNMNDFEKYLENEMGAPEFRKEYEALETESNQARKEVKAFGILHGQVRGRKLDLEVEENAGAEAAVEKYQRKMQEELLDTYAEERECDYKDRHYRVRDNGSILRLPKDPSKPRKGDNEWTFGTHHTGKQYLFIGPHQVHRIVATAFHGEPEAETDVVDHIDTNGENNRPENLRWTTRLGNALNPATRKKLELMTGLSIEKILEDPSILKQYNLDREYEWMGAVSKEEAERTLKNIREWAEKPYEIPKTPYEPRGKVLRPIPARNISPLRSTPYEMEHTTMEPMADEDEGLPAGCIRSLTPNALERRWRAPYKFPFCPQQGGDLKSYFEAIEIGEEVAIGKGYSFFATEKAMNRDGTAICLKTMSGEDSIKPYGVMTITMEDGWFIHEGRGYFQEDGQEKYFTIAKDEEWTGGDVFDDFC